MNSRRHSILLLCLACSLAGAAPSLTPEQQSWLVKAKRSERGGWIYLHTEGEPRQRGFQHGYLLAAEIGKAMQEVEFSVCSVQSGAVERGADYKSALRTWLITLQL